MTSMRNALKALFVICFVIHGGHSDLTAHQNRYLAHLFHKYGSHGIISFEVSFLFSIKFMIHKKKNFPCRSLHESVVKCVLSKK